MGLRERLDAVLDRIATVAASVFVTAPDHPGRGGATGDTSDFEGRTEHADDTEEKTEEERPS